MVCGSRWSLPLTVGIREMPANDTYDGFSYIYRYARARVTPITGTSVISVIGRVDDGMSTTKSRQMRTNVTAEWTMIRRALLVPVWRGRV